MSRGWRRDAADVVAGWAARPGRFGLVFLALFTGSAALAVLTAILDGLELKSRRIVAELGANVVALVAPPAGGAEAPGLAGLHLRRLREGLPGCRISGLRRHVTATLGAGQELAVVATDPELPAVRGWAVPEGRFFDAGDLRDGARVAVINRKVAAALDWGVGQVIVLQGVPFRIVGVVDEGADAVEREARDAGLVLGERVVYVPAGADPLRGGRRGPPDALDQVFIAAPGAGNLRDVLAAARNLMSQPDATVPGCDWITPASLIEGLRRWQRMLRLTAGSIVALALLLGGTTLSSLMVANVRERVTEIGLRRALGATRRDIARLFVWEGVVLAAASAAAGTGAAHLFLLAVHRSWPLPLHAGVPSVTVPLTVSLALAALFAWLPARMAAAISPAEALRNE